MFRLPEEDIDRLWRQMGENKDWKGFMKTVMTLCGRIEFDGQPHGRLPGA